MPKYRIRDWNIHFEQDRSRQWKHLQWVPIPNRQGSGYRRMVKEKNGSAIFGCWIALVEVGSTCSPRGDLSKYSIEALTDLSMMPMQLVKETLSYCSQVLDWIEDIENLDKNVKNLDVHGMPPASGSSILFNSVLSCSEEEGMQGGKKTPFDIFWDSYPKKVGKGAAIKAWSKTKAAAATLPNMLLALSWQTASEQWTKDNGQYIPNPSTYLNQQRWLDEPTSTGYQLSPEREAELNRGAAT